MAYIFVAPSLFLLSAMHVGKHSFAPSKKRSVSVNESKIAALQRKFTNQTNKTGAGKGRAKITKNEKSRDADTIR